jgi:hypothetical protein
MQTRNLRSWWIAGVMSGALLGCGEGILTDGSDLEVRDPVLGEDQDAARAPSTPDDAGTWDDEDASGDDTHEDGGPGGDDVEDASTPEPDPEPPPHGRRRRAVAAATETAKVPDDHRSIPPPTR